MPFNLRFEIEGEVQLSRNLRIIADKVKDWTPAFKQTAETLKDIFSNDVFASQGGVIQEHWSPLSKGYALKKAREHPGKGLLEATGAMRNGFMTVWGPEQAKIWNRVEYFKYHQSNQPRTKMPRRVMIKLAEAQRQQVVRIFNSYFQQIVKA